MNMNNQLLINNSNNNNDRGVNARYPFVLVVEFKQEQRVRIRARPEFAGALNQYVVVDLDHGLGVDCGVVVLVVDSRMAQALIPAELGAGPSNLGRALRFATPQDCDVINNELPALEERAMDRAAALAHTHLLPFQIVDAEVQFDRSCVKIFYVLKLEDVANNLLKTSKMGMGVAKLQRELAVFLGVGRIQLEQLVPVEEVEQQKLQFGNCINNSTNPLVPRVPTNNSNNNNNCGNN